MCHLKFNHKQKIIHTFQHISLKNSCLFCKGEVHVESSDANFFFGEGENGRSTLDRNSCRSPAIILNNVDLVVIYRWDGSCLRLSVYPLWCRWDGSPGGCRCAPSAAVSTGFAGGCRWSPLLLLLRVLSAVSVCHLCCCWKWSNAQLFLWFTICWCN